MVAINFVAWPKEYTFNVIREYIKQHTIRKERKRPIKVDDELQLYWKMRTKECEKISDAICTYTYPIVIRPEERAVYYLLTYIQGTTTLLEPLTPPDFRSLWKKDGFLEEEDFWDYFREGGRYDVIGWRLLDG